jgi:hypothetical protein
MRRSRQMARQIELATAVELGQRERGHKPRRTLNGGRACESTVCGQIRWVFSLGVALRSADGTQSRTGPNDVSVSIFPFKQ